MLNAFCLEYGSAGGASSVYSKRNFVDESALDIEGIGLHGGTQSLHRDYPFFCRFLGSKSDLTMKPFFAFVLARSLIDYEDFYLFIHSPIFPQSI